MPNRFGKKLNAKLSKQSRFATVKKKINRGYLLFLGEYQIYFIECDENISKFTSA